ncbi:RNA methyltransferase [Fundidesulfovibrio soli]|uniref:RNA methyltransferase n=1 Tax=Fundidesulfovibrio soli TaxID=2922716 RepID=UPI001FAF7FBA|nr:RNA methyltransferase [Fundidesulfovibrio soli]
MLSNLAVVLFRPKFSANIGSTARAMANMGCSRLIVVSPQEWDEGRARALATQKGQEILDSMTVVDDLAQALAPFQAVYGTTARTGGWRKGLLTPETAAARGMEAVRAGSGVAILFGPEDKGLTNDETKVCDRLVCIPTSEEASSLNLSQAVLIILYEFMKAATARAVPAAALQSAEEPGEPAPAQESRAATHKEREALFANLREALTAIDFIKDDNPDYWMLPVRAFVERIRLKRAEFNMLMGLCRQVKWAVGAKRPPKA